MSRLLKDPGQSHFGFWILDFGLKRPRNVIGGAKSEVSNPKFKGMRANTENETQTDSRNMSLQSKIQNPNPKIREESGAALIISVAIFAVLLFIGLTFWSASRIEHQAAVRHQQSFQGDMLANAGQALAVSQLRLDKKWHPNYTSLDHGWNSYFNGAWLAGKPWAFKRDFNGAMTLDRTWTSWVNGAPFKRVPYIDYWVDVKRQEAELDFAVQRALYLDGVDGIDNDGDGETDEADETRESLGSALAQIKNPLFVPRFQTFPNDDTGVPTLITLLDQQYADQTTGNASNSDFLSAYDFPVQYGYDFSGYNPDFDDPISVMAAYHNSLFNDINPYDSGWPARRLTPQQKLNLWGDVDSDGDGLRDAMWIPIGVEVFRGGIDRDDDGRVGADEGGDGIDNDLDGIVDEPDETAVYVYWGGNDGLDNDQDTQIDEADEQRVYLTAPLIADSYWAGLDYEDNNGNNTVWESDGVDNDGDGAIDETNEGVDEPGEASILLTTNDRVDNNGGANPCVGLLDSGRPAYDFNDPGESIPLLGQFYVQVNLETLNEFITAPGNPIQIAAVNDSRLFLSDPADPCGPSVDRLDNDFTQIVNDTHGHVFLEPYAPQFDNGGNVNFPWTEAGILSGVQQNRARSYGRINVDRDDPNSYYYALSPLVFPLNPNSGPFHVVATCAGEVVCVVAGRVAVQIVDEASKFNLNTTGAIATALELDPNDTTRPQDNLRLVPPHNEGIHAGELDPRVLPGIGVQRGLDFAVERTGEHRDAGGRGKPQNFTQPGNSGLLNPNDQNDSDENGTFDNTAEAGYAYDTYFPGFGMTDDNANALQLQFNGIDDDGDGAYYLNDNRDNDGDGFFDEPDEARFGIDEPFEGIDEPQELQLYRPLRNRLAELDGRDNDNDGSVDEIGELGDKLYNTGDEMRAALFGDMSDGGIGIVEPLRLAVTVQSTDSNARYQHYVSGGQGDLARNLPNDTAPVTGMKIDYNYATADAIVNALKEDWSYPSIDDVIRTEVGYPALPPQSDLFTNLTLSAFDKEPANPYLIAVSAFPEARTIALANNADGYIGEVFFTAAYMAGMRRESSTIVGAPIGVVDTRFGPFNLATDLTTVDLTLNTPPGRIFEADAGLRAYQLALNIVDARDTDHLRNTSFMRQGDDWWTSLFAAGSPQPVREITYGFSGTEGIRINEIMVRAVRRIEAESNYDPDTADLDPHAENNPNVFVAGTEVDFNVATTTMFDLVTGTEAVPATRQEWAYFPDTGDPIADRVGLGKTAGFDTDAFEVTDGTFVYDNLIQFRITPSAQVPPGRYYLMINTVGADGRPTVDEGSDIVYRVKYARDAENDILDDVRGFRDTTLTVDPFNHAVINTTVRPTPYVGRVDAGTQYGWAFLPTETIIDEVATPLPAGYEGYGGIPGETYLRNYAFTVIVPPYAQNAADQYSLYVAIKKTADDGVPLAINFLDLSQEPDHEWVEIVNVSESSNPINLSNWILEVGGGANDPLTRRFTIPANTQISQNGSLLLVTDKYDDNFGQVPNGIGATSNNVSFTDATPTLRPSRAEIAIPRYLAPGDAYFDANRATLGTMAGAGPNAWTGQWGAPLASNIGAQSDFQRITGSVDFVDKNGDGESNVADDTAADDVLVSTTYAEVAGGLPNKPWDRIVQLQTVPIINEAQVAELVLSGGNFPNYPDEDFSDNDGDATELMRDGIDNDGDRIYFDNDNIDNDGDTLIDEGADGLDNNGNGLIDEALESEGTDEPVYTIYDFDGIDNDGDGLIDEGRDGVDNPTANGLIDDYAESEGFNISEGVDEGAVPRFSQFDFVSGALNPVPGSFSRFPATMLFANEPSWVKGLDQIGNDDTMPEWKEFTERRFYPGDNVRVTLYAGLPEDNFIVDRVTYNQNDVENRAPDDVMSMFTVVGAGHDFFQSRFRMEQPILGDSNGHPRAWPENTMGVDFYRSLERKHPLFPGDRFGVANRWTATDGNYDDWAPGTNRWFFDSAAAAAPFEASMMSNLQYNDPVTGNLTSVSGELFYGHGFSGSPLRANFFQRVLSDMRYGPDPTTVRLVSDDGPVVPDVLMGDNRLLLSRARVRNANFRSPGDLLTVPHMTLTRTYADREHNLLGREAVQGPAVAPENMLAALFPDIPPHLKGATIGMDFPKDLRALIDIASFDSIALNVGQADFYPLYPHMGTLTGGGSFDLAEWHRADGSTPAAGDIDTNHTYRAPVAWSPVFLASLDPSASEPESDSFSAVQTITITQAGTPQYPNLLDWPGYPIQMASLYRNADLGFVQPYNGTGWLLQDPVSTASARWPIERRAMMYVSSNPDGFRPELAGSHNIFPGDPLAPNPYPSEALFVWDGADGLPNGEYDLYVVTMPDLTGLFASSQLRDASRQDWLPFKLDPSNGQLRRRLPIDIQVLTDKDGDRRCWIDGRAPTNPTPGMPDSVELGFNTQSPGNTIADQREKFPLKGGLVPASDGTVHYGVVKIENNFLGVFVRNWASPGADNVNAVSRVVLMSRDRTPGRININTALTQPIINSATGDPDAFNPMTGLVGFKSVYTADTTAGSDLGLFTPMPWADIDDVGTAAPYSMLPPYPSAYNAVLARATQLVGPVMPQFPDPLFLPRGERFMDFNSDGLPDSPSDIDPVAGDNQPDFSVRYDGRYLLSPGELVVGGDEGAFGPRPMLMMPSIISLYATDDGVTPTAFQKAQQFDELKERYARMGNSVTTVSDTFEIYVTAQTGYVFDANTDGVLNWRDDTEFVITGEKKLRTVYER